MPIPLKKLGIKLLLGALSALRALGRLFLALLRFLAIPFVMLWRYGLRQLAFLIYKLLLHAKISMYRALPPFRRTFFAIFGHRYVVHVMMATIAFFVAGTNLYARGAELGQDSTQALLYRLVDIETDYELAATAEGPDNFLDQTHSASDTAEFAAPGTDEGLLTYDQSGVAKPIILPGGSKPAEEEKMEIAQPVKYVIQQGDTISGIAKKYGVSINTVLWANNMTTRSVLRLGQELTILPVSGVLHTVKKGETLGAIAKKYGTEIDEILQANKIASAAQIRIGEQLVVPGGRPPVTAAPRPAPARPGNVADVFRPPTEAPPPSSAAATAVAGQMIWPTDQKRINQYFKWNHPGLDINGSKQNSTYTVDDGIVTYAGWNKGGYGNMILIDHGNGLITRYAHHSKMYVKAGDQVTKGQTIGMVGSTGRSTGPHLHFELYVNGKRVNPLTYYK